MALIDKNFYNSQSYKDYQNGPAAGPSTQDMYNSPYFGQMSSGSLGQAQDRAYEQYLTSTGQPVPSTGQTLNNPFNNAFNSNNSALSTLMYGSQPGMSQTGGLRGNIQGMAASPPQNSGFLGNVGNHKVPDVMATMFNSPIGVPQNSGFQGYNPSPINSTGSYNSGDYASLLGGLFTGGVTGAAAGAGVNDAVARLQALGQSGINDYTNLAKTVTQDINFKPYALTNSLGSTRQTAPGVIDQQLTPQQQSNVNMASGAQGGLYNFSGIPNTSGMANQAFGQAQQGLMGVGQGQEDIAALRAGYGSAAQGMTGMLGGSTNDMASQLFNQQQAMRDPVQQRQQMELENRLRSQGRLGVSTAAYGGTPEQLAMAKAQQEQQSADAFNSISQGEQLASQQQARALGLGQATTGMAQAQQTLRAGDVANASSLFNLGSSAAQLPSQMQGQQIAQAGQLQDQALAPGAQQLAQLAASSTLGEQEANVAATRGRMFGDLAAGGLQERLTAESAGAALRGKQYTAALGALANKGAISGGDANTVQGMIQQGVTRVGNDLVDAAGTVIKGAYGALSAGVKSAWDSITSDSNGFSGVPGIDFGGGGGIDGGGWGSLAETTGEATNIIEDAWSAVSKWWDSW